MNRCPVTDQLVALLCETLAPADETQIVTHVETCERCQNSLAKLTSSPVSTAIPSLKNSRADSSFLDEIREKGPSVSQLEIDEPWQHILSPAQADNELGRIGIYAVYAEVGRGGMGIVLRARDTALDRMVALKIMRPSLVNRQSYRDRFLREARAIAAIDHTHVVPIYQVSHDSDFPFMAMKLLQGESLADRLRAVSSLPEPVVRRIGRQVALGLEAAHQQGLVHRDVKPGNIWLEAPDDHVRVLDFGLIRPNDGDSQITQSGAVIGTPAYISPEQARGETVSASSDIFGLGAVMYESATGTLPFAGKSVIETLSALALATPKNLRQVAPDFSAETSMTVMRMLQKEPADRPASANEVAQMLTPDLAYHNDQPHRRQLQVVLALIATAIIVVVSAVMHRTSTGEITVEYADEVQPNSVAIEAKKSSDKRIAQWVLEARGEIRLASENLVPIKDLNALPKEPGAIHTIDLQNVEMVDDDIDHLAELSRLTKLKLGSTDGLPSRLTGRVLGRLADLRVPGLRELYLQDIPLPPRGLADLTRLSELYYLSITRGGVTDGDLKHLAKLPELRRIVLADQTMSGSGLVHLKDTPLTLLSLSTIQIDDDAIINMPAWESLEFLRFDRIPISDAVMLSLCRFQKLSTLQINRVNRQGDGGWKVFPSIPSLEHLSLRGNRAVTDVAVEQIVESLPQLARLEISSTRITDVGLRHLKAAKLLRHLDVCQIPELSPIVVSELKEALPDCEITTDSSPKVTKRKVGS